jgi:hypothetical protein
LPSFFQSLQQQKKSIFIFLTKEPQILFNVHQLQRGINNGAAFLFFGSSIILPSLYKQVSDLSRYISALFHATGIFKLKAKMRLLPFEFIHDKAFKFFYIVESSPIIYKLESNVLINFCCARTPAILGIELSGESPSFKRYPMNLLRLQNTCL